MSSVFMLGFLFSIWMTVPLNFSVLKVEFSKRNKMQLTGNDALFIHVQHQNMPRQDSGHHLVNCFLTACTHSHRGYFHLSQQSRNSGVNNKVNNGEFLNHRCYNTCTFPIVKSHSDLYPDADVPQHFLFINIKMISHVWHHSYTTWSWFRFFI